MADLNTTLRLALRSPKEPLNSEPVEALHFPGAVEGPSDAPPESQSPLEAMAVAMKAVAGANKPQAAAPAPQSDATGPVKVIDGDHYTSGGTIP
jgi:hypothetical protein